MTRIPDISFVPLEAGAFEDRGVVLKPTKRAKVGRAAGKAKPSLDNFIFDNKVLSRAHAEVWIDNPDDPVSERRVMLRDVGSSNGTFINKGRLSDSGIASNPVQLHSGDIVLFGVDLIDTSGKVEHGAVKAKILIRWEEVDLNEFEAKGTGSLSSKDEGIEDITDINTSVESQIVPEPIATVVDAEAGVEPAGEETTPPPQANGAPPPPPEAVTMEAATRVLVSQLGTVDKVMDELLERHGGAAPNDGADLLRSEQIVALNEKIEDLEGVINATQNKLGETIEMNNVSKKTIGMLQKETAQLEKESGESNSVILELQRERVELEQQLKTAERERHELESALEVQIENATRMRKDVEDTKLQLEGRARAAQEHQAYKDKAEARHKEHRDEITRLKKTATEASEKVEVMQRKMTEYELMIQSREALAKEASNSMVELNALAAEETAKATKHERAALEAKEAMSDMHSRVEGLQDDLAASAKQLENMMAEHSQMAEDNVELISKCGAQERKLCDAQEALAMKESESERTMAEVRTKLHEKTKILEARTTENAELKDVLAASKARGDTEATQAAELKSATDKAAAEHTTEIAALRSDNEELQKSAKAAVTALETASGRNSMTNVSLVVALVAALAAGALDFV